MIPKGNQRGGGQQLATHLLNSFDNEKIEIAELRGAVAPDLHGAFAEWRAQSTATKAKKYLYSLSVNPDHRQGPFKRAQYFDFIHRVEKKLGLGNQPRAVVFHTKQGREHCHVVWSRIDTRKMKAVQLSHDRQDLRDVAQKFAKDHGITLPPAMQKNRGADRYGDREKRENLADKQQQERSGLSKQQHKDAITALWKENGAGESFVKALEDAGYILARGDKGNPTYVVVDLSGEVHSLARRIEGAKTKDIKARLAAFPLDRLRSVAEAKALAQEQRERKSQAAAPTKQGERAPDLETRRRELADRQNARREALRQNRVEMESRHGQEKKALAELQDGEKKGVLLQRAAKHPKGLIGFLARITGIQALVARHEKKLDQQRDREHVQQRVALLTRHERERHEFTRNESSLARVEKRENRSLRTAERREQLKALQPQAKAPARLLSPEQQEKLVRARALAAKFNRAAGDPRAVQLTPAQRAAIEARKKGRKTTLAPAFNKAASEKEKTSVPKPGSQPPSPAVDGTLTAVFTKSAAGSEPQKTDDGKKIKNGHAGGGDAGSGLTEAFRKAQEEQRRERENKDPRKARTKDMDRDR